MDGLSPLVTNGESSREVNSPPCFRTPEVLFQPGMLGLEAHGIHETVCVWSSFAFPAEILIHSVVPTRS